MRAQRVFSGVGAANSNESEGSAPTTVDDELP